MLTGGVRLDANATPHGKRVLNWLALLLLLFASAGHAIELFPKQVWVLEDFFRVMLEKSEGGYVLLGKKPVCIHGFHVEDAFLGENDRHNASVYLREGALQWKQLALDRSDENIIVHIYNEEDTLAKNYIHILFINRDLFLKAVSENISLFQYVLGPDVTPTQLLAKLIDPNAKFHAILKNDRVLIGILLGYGVENALYVSRIENIEESLFSSEQPPYESSLLALGDVRKEYLQILLTKTRKPLLQNSPLQPSFGYSSLKEEMQALASKVDISSPQLATQFPTFIFGRLKQHEKNRDFITELEETQVKINELLNSSLFLETVLQKIFPNEEIIINDASTTTKQLPFNESEIKQLPFLVAANVKKMISDENEIFLNAFIQGFRDSEKELVIPKILPKTFGYEKTKALKKINNNLQTSTDFFERIHKDPSIVCLIPHKLYYRGVEEGAGLFLNDYAKATFHYSIKTPDDQLLADTWRSGNPVELDLSKTISGFSQGVKGMKKGEIREIFIHPCLAYGVYTTLEKGIYLRAFVKLVEIDEKQKVEKVTKLNTLELNVDISPSIDSEYQEEAKIAGYATGFQIGQHYKKCPLYKLSQILYELNLLQKEQHYDISSKTSQDIINKLHWNLYHL